MSGPAVGLAILRRRRRSVALAGVVMIVVFGTMLGHVGQHMLRSMLVPGSGLYDQHLLLGVGVTVAAVMATVAWVRWGADWAVVVVLATSVVLSGLLANSHHEGGVATALTPSAAAHEFPLVIIVVGALGWVRSVMRQVPVVRHLHRRSVRERQGIDDIGTLPPVDRCRTAVVAALAGGWSTETERAIVAAIEAPDVARRARRINAISRGRLGGDPFRRDHAVVRAALTLWGCRDEPGADDLHGEAARSWTGVPSSEPGWVRLVDGTMTVAALASSDPVAAERWASTLTTSMTLHRGHRPASVWTPLGFHLGRADEWEHVAATALARANGWIRDDDWAVLRQRALGAAARGAGHPADERTIAAARIWVALVGDTDADRVLSRPTIRRDPLAVALDAYATRVRDDAHRPMQGAGA